MHLTNPNPSEARKEAGNYRKKKIRWHGLRISIENPAGSMRSGTDRKGKKWQNYMPHDYGYITGTRGKDGDQVDVFIGPHSKSELVTIINQIDPRTGKFDEHKCMLGFFTKAEAIEAYKAAYDPKWKGLGSATSMSLDQFKKWVRSGRKMGPVQFAVASLVEPVEFARFPRFKINKAHSEIGWKSQAATVKPDDFLKKAAHIANPNQKAIEKYRHQIRSASNIPAPQLWVKRTGKGLGAHPGNFKVIGHEGRHRMIAAKLEGIKRVPVEVIANSEARVPKRSKILKKGMKMVRHFQPEESRFAARRSPIEFAKKNVYSEGYKTPARLNGAFPPPTSAAYVTPRKAKEMLDRRPGVGSPTVRSRATRAGAIINNTRLPNRGTILSDPSFAPLRGNIVEGWGDFDRYKKSMRRHEIAHSVIQHRRGGPPRNIAGLAREEVAAYKAGNTGKKLPKTASARMARLSNAVGGIPTSIIQGARANKIPLWKLFESRHSLVEFSEKTLSQRLRPFRIEKRMAAAQMPTFGKGIRKAMLAKGSMVGIGASAGYLTGGYAIPVGMAAATGKKVGTSANWINEVSSLEFGAIPIDTRNLSMKGKVIKFAERTKKEKKGNNALKIAGVGALLAGGTTLPAAIPMLRISGRRMISKIPGIGGRMIGNDGGRFVRDYIKSSNRALNLPGVGRGIEAMKRRTSGGRTVKIFGKEITRPQVDHYAGFRTGPRGTLRTWGKEAAEWTEVGGFDRKKPLTPKVASRLKKKADVIRSENQRVERTLNRYIQRTGASERKAVNKLTRSKSRRNQAYMSGLARGWRDDIGVYTKAALVSPALIAAGTAGVYAENRKKEKRTSFAAKEKEDPTRIVKDNNAYKWAVTSMPLIFGASAIHTMIRGRSQNKLLRQIVNNTTRKKSMSANQKIINFRAYSEWDGTTGINPKTKKFEDNRNPVRKALPYVIGGTIAAGIGGAILFRNRSRVPFMSGTHPFGGSILEPRKSRLARAMRVGQVDRSNRINKEAAKFAEKEAKKSAARVAAKTQAKTTVKKTVAKKVPQKRKRPGANGGTRGSTGMKAKLMHVTEFNLRNPEHGNQYTASLRPSAAYRKATTARRWANRSGEVVKDLDDMVSGTPRDPKKKRFYEKSWFKNTLLTGAIASPIVATRGLAAARKSLPFLPNWVNKSHTSGRSLFAADHRNVIEFGSMGRKRLMRVLRSQNKYAKKAQEDAFNASMMSQPNTRMVGEKLKVANAASRKVRKAYSKGSEVTAQKLVHKWPILGMQSRSRLIELSTYRTGAESRMVGWDVRDARGNSARVFTPDGAPRTRRKKKPSERIDNIRKTRNVAIAAALAGAGGVAYLGLSKAALPSAVRTRLPAMLRSASKRGANKMDMAWKNRPRWLNGLDG